MGRCNEAGIDHIGCARYENRHVRVGNGSGHRSVGVGHSVSAGTLTKNRHREEGKSYTV